MIIDLFFPDETLLKSVSPDYLSQDVRISLLFFKEFLFEYSLKNKEIFKITRQRAYSHVLTHLILFFYLIEYVTTKTYNLQLVYERFVVF